MAAAFTGADKLLFVSANGPDDLRITQHRTVVDAARAAGVGLPGFLIELLVDADVKAAQGALQTVTGDLAALLGRLATTLREAVTAALRH